VATDDHYSINHDTTLIVPAGGVLTNDFDAENDSLTTVCRTQFPPHGILGGSVIAGGVKEGGFNYYPDSGFVGTDSFTYYVTDGTLWSQPATITITVNPPPGQKLVNGDFGLGLGGWTASTGVAKKVFYNSAVGASYPYLAIPGPAGQISQTSPTIAGRKYQLTFQAMVFGQTTPVDMLATVQGAGPLLNQSVSVAGVQTGFLWQTQTFTFVADGPSAALTISHSSGSAGVSLQLRHIRVTDLTNLQQVFATQSLSGAPGNPTVSMNITDPGTYLLERSSDLNTWTRVRETVVHVPGRIDFLDSQPAASPQGTGSGPFYRVGLRFDY
jgi:hypothetical protein